MIKLENYEVVGWEHVIRGMRNPKNSWAKSDSLKCGCASDCDICIDYDDCPFDHDCHKLIVGDADKDLMMRLAKGGPVHAKYRRMITVYVDITAPLYWWKEFDTYKVGTVANSCSTMHKIADKEFTIEDFSHEKLEPFAEDILYGVVKILEHYRQSYNDSKNSNPQTSYDKDNMKSCFENMIQLLPSSYNQKRTIMLNYEVLHNMYKWRKNHKLDEWVEFCKWIETLPYSEIITCKEGEE